MKTDLLAKYKTAIASYMYKLIGLILISFNRSSVHDMCIRWYHTSCLENYMKRGISWSKQTLWDFLFYSWSYHIA